MSYHVSRSITYLSTAVFKAVFTLVRYWEKLFQKLPFSGSKRPFSRFRPYVYTNPMKTQTEKKNFWIRKQRWIFRKQRYIANIIFLGFSRVNSENGSKPAKIHHCLRDFYMVQSWKTGNGRLYSIVHKLFIYFASVSVHMYEHVWTSICTSTTTVVSHDISSYKRCKEQQKWSTQAKNCKCFGQFWVKFCRAYVQVITVWNTDISILKESKATVKGGGNCGAREREREREG